MTAFVSWISANMGGLRKKAAEAVAERIGDEILKVDERLGVEVSHPSRNQDREVIITAFSDQELFPLVRTIVELIPQTPGWNFVALKPPRGFEFTITVGDHEMYAKTLEFRSIPKVRGGIQLLIPHTLLGKLPSDEESQELAWLIVETGLGEELSSKLAHIEFSSLENAADAHPIAELAQFLVND